LPKWWLNLWNKLEPLIKKERERRKINELCADFQWLAEDLVKEKSEKDNKSEKS